MNTTTIDGWTCKDIGTVVYQGYAPDRVKILLERQCDLPDTGMQMSLWWIAIPVLLICMGLLLRKYAR